MPAFSAAGKPSCGSGSTTIRESSPAASRAISRLPSVDPSEMTISSKARNVWLAMLSIDARRNRSPFQTGSSTDTRGSTGTAQSTFSVLPFRRRSEGRG